MAGSLTIPNTFTGQSGNVPASQLDANWSAIANYVNPREVTLGALGSRPAAGTAGRWYCATDTGGGTLYVDTGVGWTQVASGVSQATAGGYRVTGLTGTNNTGTPNTQYDLAADLVVLRNPSDGSLAVRTNTGTVTNNVLTAGSTANGRDQAGAFTATSFLHFYFIWNGATLATLSSATAPPTGPSLPAGYTHWAYAGAVFFDGSSHLVTTLMRGALMAYVTQQTVVNTATSGTGEATVSVSSVVPANALTYDVNFSCGMASNETMTFRVVTGVNYSQYLVNLGANSDLEGREHLPNVGQQFFYITSGSRQLIISVLGYRVPNGGE